MKRISLFILIIPLLIITACGGGGGGGNGPAAVTKATLKLATSGTGTTIYGIDVTVNLAPGVTVKSANPPETDTGVVTASGVVSGTTTTAIAVYTAATGTVPGKVRILIVNANGFTTGEFCTVNGDIATGHLPKAADFSLENFSAWGAENVINGLTPGYTAVIQ